MLFLPSCGQPKTRFPGFPAGKFKPQGGTMAKNSEDRLFLKRFQVLMARRPEEKLVKFKLLKHKNYREQKAILKETLEECREAGFSAEEINDILISFIEAGLENEAKLIALAELLNRELSKVARYFLNQCDELDEKSRREKFPDLKLVH